MTKCLARVAQFVGAVDNGHQLSGFKTLAQVRQVPVLPQEDQADGLVCGLPNPPAEDHELEQQWYPFSTDGYVCSARVVSECAHSKGGCVVFVSTIRS